MTTKEFEQIVNDWITTAKHPKTGGLYLILNFEFLRLGFVRLDTFNQALVELRASMN